MPADSAVVDPELRGPAQPTGPVGIFKVRALRHIGSPCPYCAKPMQSSGRMMVTRDHILPRMILRSVYSGAFRVKLQQVNIIYACRRCNEFKDNLTLMQFSGLHEIGTVRRNAVLLLIEQLRQKHPPDIFAVLVGAKET